MTKKLFIDDVRVPETVGLNSEDFDIVRDYDSAISYIEKHKPQYIAFDHDLADEHYAAYHKGESDFTKFEKTGYQVAKWLIEQDIISGDYITVNFEYSVHSYNPIGAKNIDMLLYNYITEKFR